MKPNTDQPKASESKSGSKPKAMDDLKSLPMTNVFVDQRRWQLRPALPYL